MVGPALGALGGTTTPFITYALLLAVIAPATALLPPPTTGRSSIPTHPALRTRRSWVSAIGIMLAILTTGALDGVLPLPFADRLSQTSIGAVYLLVGALIAVGSAAAGHPLPDRMVVASPPQSPPASFSRARPQRWRRRP